MSREIKFRVWDTENERMVTPYFFEPSGHSDTGYRYYEDWRDLEDGRSFPCYVMQFTGLKDKNGVEIYEGDILQVKEPPPRGNYGLKYVALFNENETAFRLRWEDRYADRLSDPTGFYDRKIEPNQYEVFEVIGNVYENPELLAAAAAQQGR